MYSIDCIEIDRLFAVWAMVLLLFKYLYHGLMNYEQGNVDSRRGNWITSTAMHVRSMTTPPSNVYNLCYVETP